jgi:hypothetical protein
MKKSTILAGGFAALVMASAMPSAIAAPLSPAVSKAEVSSNLLLKTHGYYDEYRGRRYGWWKHQRRWWGRHGHHRDYSDYRGHGRRGDRDRADRHDDRDRDGRRWR